MPVGLEGTPHFSHAGDFFGEDDGHQRDRKVRVWHSGFSTRLDGWYRRDVIEHQQVGTPPPPSHNPYFPLISTPHIAHSPGQPNPAANPLPLHPHTAPPCTSSLDTLKNLDPLTPALSVCAGTDRTIPAAAVLPTRWRRQQKLHQHRRPRQQVQEKLLCWRLLDWRRTVFF